MLYYCELSSQFSSSALRRGLIPLRPAFAGFSILTGQKETLPTSGFPLHKCSSQRTLAMDSRGPGTDNTAGMRGNQWGQPYKAAAKATHLCQAEDPLHSSLALPDNVVKMVFQGDCTSSGRG